MKNHSTFLSILAFVAVASLSTHVSAADTETLPSGVKVLTLGTGASPKAVTR